MPTTSDRILFVDVARAGAVLLMIQGHALQVLLSPEYQGGTVFSFWLYVRGLTSCTFLLLAGFSFSLVTTRHWMELRIVSPRTRRRLMRFATFLLLGYSMRIPTRPVADIWRVTAEQWQAFSVVDILHLVAVTLTLLQVFAWIASTPRRLGFGAGLATIVVVLLTPGMWSVHWRNRLPVFVASYLSNETGSLFPIFPWAAYVFLGAALGAWFSTSTSPLRNNVHRAFALTGVTMFVSGIALHRLPMSPFGPSDFWTTSPNLFLVKGGSVLVLLAGAAWLTRSRVAVPRMVTALSRESLTVYFVHVCILYGSIWNEGLHRTIGPHLDLVAVTAWIALLAGSMSLLACVWHECKRRQVYLSAAIRAAVVGGLVYVIS